MKIGLGMLVAAAAYILLTIGSLGLPAPEMDAAGQPMHMADVSANWLISTYLVLTFAELLLSPIGISFVTKVAPPKYKGMMMGGWFVATAIGNFLVAIPALMWGASLTVVWGVLTGICLLAALFVFAILKWYKPFVTELSLLTREKSLQTKKLPSLAKRLVKTTASVLRLLVQARRFQTFLRPFTA